MPESTTGDCSFYSRLFEWKQRFGCIPEVVCFVRLGNFICKTSNSEALVSDQPRFFLIIILAKTMVS
ncbi:hypothetical protein ZWY2020_047555 [Hordeum vulgare]|nr:hypothetical protein ZWY2020_047555 [Hordeum vulgare]